MKNSILIFGFILCVGRRGFVLSQNPETNVGIMEKLQHVHRINSQSQRYLAKTNEPGLSHETAFISSFSEDLAARAEEILASDWSATQYDVSSVCLNHTEMILNGITAGDMWAFRMIDAMGKPPSGLLDLNIVWLGSFDECVNTEVTLYEDPDNMTNPYQPFTTQYCLTRLPLGGESTNMLQNGLALTVGMCLPKTCSNSDVGALTNTLLSLIPGSVFNTSQLPSAQGECKSNGDLELDGAAKFSIVVCSLFLTVMTLATFYDLYIVFWLNRTPQELPTYKPVSNNYGSVSKSQEADPDTTPLLNSNTSDEQPAKHLTKVQTKIYQPGTLGTALLSFSVYTNGKKILSTSQPSGTLTAMNGVRFISMQWVLLGHTYAFGLNSVSNIATYLPEMFKRLSFQVIGNGTISVDTFFVISGLLVAYLSLKEMQKRGGAGNFKWGMFYFHRFWRLTPPYMLFMMFYVPLIKYWLKGPLAPEGGLDQTQCEKNWWTNLLYINNFVNADAGESCMAWSWYLANDMQFYIVSPLMLVPLYYSPLWGAVSCLAFIATGTITTGAISGYYGLKANMVVDPNQDIGFMKIYIKPWCRVAPYAVGVFTGYILYKCECKVKMSKLMNALGWLTATVAALLVQYGLYDPDGLTGDKMSDDVAALYSATFRLVWGMCVCWVVFACATGYGGPVNTFLSWRAMIPLSRLTYCSYLVHPVIIYTYNFSRRTTMYWYDLELTYLYLAQAVLTLAVAFVVSLAFESPMMGLEKALLGRGKKDR